MLTPKQKAFLKKIAVQTKVTVKIGNKGITEAVLKSINEVLVAKELVKINFPHDAKSEREKVAQMLAEKTNSECIHILGKTILLYRQNLEKPTISIKVNAIA